MAIGLVGVAVFVVLFFAFANTWINPLWVTPAPWTDESFASHRQIYSNIRTAKAGLVRSLEWDVAMLGSSRVAIGLDPDNPNWQDKEVVNLGISGGSISENSPIIRYTIKHQPEIEEIILGLDLTDLTSDTDLARGAGFYESPFNEKGDAIERELRYIFGFSTAEAAYKTVMTRLNENALQPYTQKGHWARHRSVDPVRLILERDSVPFAMRYIRSRKANLELSKRKVKALEEAVRECLENKIKLTIFIPPNHSAYLCVFPLEGDPDPFFMLDRRTTVEIVERENSKYPDSPPVTLWDFNDYHPLNSEDIPPDDEPAKYWVDGTHMLETLGDVILARMEGWETSDPLEASYGQLLNSENIDEREEIIAASYERYKVEHKDDWLWVQSIINEYESTDTKARSSD